jgi:hypothetical protein
MSKKIAEDDPAYASLKRGLDQSAAGETVYLGDFVQYLGVDDETETE